MPELLESKPPVLIGHLQRTDPKGSTSMVGASDFERHTMCLEHDECRLPQEELGDVPMGSMATSASNSHIRLVVIP